MTRIGAITLANNLILAPMAGVTDRPFRELCRRWGAGLAVSEMITANKALWASPKSVRRMDHTGETGPISVQILGSDPGLMAEAARATRDLGADIIDINMGCPARKVCQGAAGSALLRDEGLVARILESVVAAVAIPVTLKIRTGWAPPERNAERIARIAHESGVAAIAVHGRTRACGYAEAAEYDTVRAIKSQLPIPVIANGDVDSPQKARFVLDYTGADAIMIGRAARGRPWIFREISDYLEPGARTGNHLRARVKDVVKAHLQSLYQFYGEHQGVLVARKHVAWYCKGRRDASRFRQRFNRAGTRQEQLVLVEGFFDGRDHREDQGA